LHQAILSPGASRARRTPVAMVLATLGAAWAYATTAYGYNMNRFKFDAGQEMSRAYQHMSVRMSQWNLFRQDVRDLFDLTISNMSKYQVLSTFVLGYSITYLYSCMPSFPAEPRWMMVIWGNCAITSTVYGVVSIWLAIHGCIAAHSANVKMLTQVVRPPIPSMAQVNAVRTSVAAYEGGNVSRMFKPPEFLGSSNRKAVSAGTGPRASANSDRGFRSVIGSLGLDNSSSSLFALGGGSDLGGVGDCGASLDGSGPSNTTNHGAGGDGASIGGGASAAGTSAATTAAESEHAAWVETRARTALADAEGGPGQSAAFQGHVRLFRHMHLTYACFSAYAFIGMAACVYDLLLAAAYLCVAHKMIKADSDGNRMQNSFFSWAATLIVAFTALVLFKLDLYVEGRKLRIFKQAVVAGPLFTCTAAHLWAAQQMNGEVTRVPQLLAMFTCLLHLLWSCLLRWEARPVACKGMLPTSFRAVRYLDVFGWLDDENGRTKQTAGSATASSSLAPGSGSARNTTTPETSFASASIGSSQLGAQIVQSVQQKGHSLLRAIDSLMEQEGYLPMEESCILHGLGEDLRQSLHMLGEAKAASRRYGSEASASSPSGIWLRCLNKDSVGQDIAYFVNTLTGEVSLEAPPFSQVIDFPAVNASVEALQRGLPQEPPSLFRPMARRPGSRYDAASMPWKYLRQASLAATYLWAVSILYIGIYEFLPQSPTAAVTMLVSKDEEVQQISRVHVSWPHAFFRPSALACTGNDLMVADKYMVHIAQMPSAWPSSELQDRSVEEGDAQLRIQPLRLANLSTYWKSLSVASEDTSAGSEQCTSLFHLEVDGFAVVEHPIPKKGCSGTVSTRRWVLSARLRSAVRAIQAVTGAPAVEMCQQRRNPSSSMEARWALYGASEHGEVVLLCPEASGATLEPRFVVAGPFPLQDAAAAPTYGAAEVVSEILGLWHDEGHAVWLLTRVVGSKQALLRAWTSGGALLGTWQLPAGRRWVSGLCGLGGGRGFLVTSVPEALGAQPEIWRLRPSLTTCVGAEGAPNSFPLRGLKPALD